MKRTPLKRKTPLKASVEKTRAWIDRSRKPLPKRSTKGAQYEREFQAMKAKMLPTHCRVCRHAAVTLHHILRRAQSGTNAASNLLPVCEPCHDWIHANIAKAKARGLLK